MTRRTPYTADGIKRVPCARCGKRPSSQQFQVCADGNQYRALCVICDVDLNRMVLRWLGLANAEELIEQYENRMLGE